MSTEIMIAIDLVAVFILVIPLYFRRHRRRDLVTAYTVLNIGVFAVSSILGSMDVGLGVGMGLFGVLSIIRLRSAEISQSEIAYYFSALSIGLIAGLGSANPLISGLLIALVLAVVAIVDAPGILPNSRQQDMRLDRAFTDEQELRQHVESLIGYTVTNLRVITVDLVNDTTLVDVRWTSKQQNARSLAPHTLRTPGATDEHRNGCGRKKPPESPGRGRPHPSAWPAATGGLGGAERIRRPAVPHRHEVRPHVRRSCGTPPDPPGRLSRPGD